MSALNDGFSMGCMLAMGIKKSECKNQRHYFKKIQEPLCQH